jgi:hypothetical protein
LLLTGCASTYYSVWEKLGRHKRDLLRSNIEQVREEQQEAGEQFKDALEQLKEFYRFEGGDLEKTYDRLSGDYDRSEEKAEAVRDRIRRVERIAGDLFEEWEEEIEQISSPTLRSDSRSKLEETRSRYSIMHRAMKRAEQSMEPVLVQFRDQVLYLKHNLNAQAIGSLQGEVGRIEADVATLIDKMNDSIAEAEAFVKNLPR